MILVMGGAFQNQKETAMELFQLTEENFVDGAVCDLGKIFYTRAIDQFHLYIRRAIAAGMNMDSFVEELLERNPNLIIVTDEIGYGIVPLEKEERIWREQTGRTCCVIASRAVQVIRVVAGIPCVLKGEPGC